MKNKKWNLIITLMLGISIVLNGYLFIENQNKTTTIVQLNKNAKFMKNVATRSLNLT